MTTVRPISIRLNLNRLPAPCACALDKSLQPAFRLAAMSTLEMPNLFLEPADAPRSPAPESQAIFGSGFVHHLRIRRILLRRRNAVICRLLRRVSLALA